MKRGNRFRPAAAGVAGCLAAAATWLAAAAPPTGAEVYKWIQQGYKLSGKDASELEVRLKQKPHDHAARVQLLAHYTDEGKPANREDRLRHILWLLENDAEERAGLAQVRSGGLLRIHCSGDPLADANGFAQARPLWIRLGRQDRKSLPAAVDAIRFCAPEAEKLLIEADDRAGLGRLYAQAALGIAGEGYRQQDPTGTDSSLRETPFAQRAVRILGEAARASTDKPLVGGAASQLMGQGGLLWADGKLDWDYTALGQQLLAAAIRLSPENLHLLALPSALPKRGERPPSVIRVGGNVAADGLVRKVTPQYPDEARLKGVEGAVKFTALIGLDGRIAGLHVESGPPELVPSATGAVRQWEYRPTLLNGKPCSTSTTLFPPHCKPGRTWTA